MGGTAYPFHRCLTSLPHGGIQYIRARWSDVVPDSRDASVPHPSLAGEDRTPSVESIRTSLTARGLRHRFAAECSHGIEQDASAAHLVLVARVGDSAISDLHLSAISGSLCYRNIAREE